MAEILIPVLKHCISSECQFPKHQHNWCTEEPPPAPLNTVKLARKISKFSWSSTIVPTIFPFLFRVQIVHCRIIWFNMKSQNLLSIYVYFALRIQAVLSTLQTMCSTQFWLSLLDQVTGLSASLEQLWLVVFFFAIYSWHSICTKPFCLGCWHKIAVTVILWLWHDNALGRNPTTSPRPPAEVNRNNQLPSLIMVTLSEEIASF
jgi:hypothetical protein